MRITVLGSGTSHGVPMIACDCAVCHSTDPRNHRTRCSIIVETARGSILVDTATELRLQACANNLKKVDAVLFTHDHADHTCGLDDLRRFNDMKGGELPCYGQPSTLASLRQRFDYVFQTPAYASPGAAVPRLGLYPLDGPFELWDYTITPIPVLHGQTPVLGYRIGAFAYVTDCNLIPHTSKALLQGLDVLILDALRRQPHPTHFSISEAIAIARELGPRQTYFTHLTHDMDHETATATLPPGIALAYDGLRFDVAEPPLTTHPGDL